MVHARLRVYRDKMRRIMAVLVLALALGASAAPAGADSRTTTDPRGGGSSYLDLYRVKVTNNARGVRIVVRMHPVDWVAFSPLGDFQLNIDTKKARGAEFSESFGLPGDGGFSALKGSKAWRRSWSTYPFAGKCGKTVVERWNLDEGKVIVKIRPKKGCLYHPKRIRVNVRTSQWGYYEDSELRRNNPPLVDHLPARKAFTPPVRYSKN